MLKSTNITRNAYNHHQNKNKIEENELKVIFCLASEPFIVVVIKINDPIIGGFYFYNNN